jgi:hypothetical protein
MVRVTIDMFSGRPNPSFTLDDKEAREILRQVQSAPEIVAPEEAAPAILGFRGLVVSLDDVGGPGQSDELHGVPSKFRVGVGGTGDRGRSFELAERLLARIGDAQPEGGAEDFGPSYKEMNLGGLVKQFLVDSATSEAFLNAPTDPEVVARTLRDLKAGGASVEGGPKRVQEGVTASADAVEAADAAALAACWNPATVLGRDASTWGAYSVGSCFLEASAFNPTFWNTASVQPYNNCYNYASNRRTDTFAQPGRATCAGTSTMQCANVSAGASSDGASQACTTGAPRWYMALVVAPNYDYHWYRYQSNGYWGHKPGSTSAKNTDDSGVVITNPQTANRGPYTSFCGYWFSPSAHIIR